MKKWLALSCFLALIVLVSGCGRAIGPTTTEVPPSPVIPTSVTFMGAGAASSSDLAKLGTTTLGIETKEERDIRISSLKARGFDDASIKAMNLRLLAVSDATATLNKINSDGSYTPLASATVSSTNGAYSIPYTNYNTADAYLITITKTATDVAKELVLEIPVSKTATAGSFALSGLNLSPQTTLLMQIIKNEVIAGLGTNKLDPDTIALIESLIISSINNLVTTEGLSITTVKSTTAAENTSLKSAAIQSYSNEIIQKAIQAIKFKAGIAKGATDLPTAKKIIKEIFTYVTGSPTGIPENIVNSFAQAYFDGATKTVAELAAASNDSCSVAGLFTASTVSSALQTKISDTYSSSTSIKSQNPIVQAVFPPSEWSGKTIDGSTTLTVPQILIMVELGNQIAAAGGGIFNPPQAVMKMGLMTGVLDKYQIMHSELRIESFEDWQNFHPTPEAGPDQRPIVSAVLTSYVDAGNLVNPNETGTITAKLFYQKADGTETSADYLLMSNFGPKSVKSLYVHKKDMGGPPPGFKMFQIAPWGDPGSNPPKITDFKRGTDATIKLYKNGDLIDSAIVPIASVDLTNAAIEFKTPYPNIFNENDPLISLFQTGTKPVLGWSFGTGSGTINFGVLTSAYAVEIRPCNSQGFADFSQPAIYSSWNKQDFVKGSQGESISFNVPQALTAGTYAVMGAVVGINQNGWPVVSGPWRSTIFKVGSAAQVIAKTVTISGEVTPPASPTSGKTIIVGLFKMGFNTDFLNSSVTPTQTTTPVGNVFSMTISYSDLATAGYGGYDTIAWEDDGNGKLDGPAERPFFPIKHMEYHGGVMNVMDQNFNPIGPVDQNKSGYNIDMSGQFWK